MTRATVLALLVSTGCLESEVVVCRDGRLCPAGSACDEEHGLCVAPDQLTACDGLADGELCEARVTAGRCDRSVCLPTCSDGVQNSGEECDDGDLKDHDGCSASCLVETPTWTQLKSPWTARWGHSAARDSARARLVVFGGTATTGTTNDLWELSENGDWEHFVDQGSTWPSPRAYAAMAFDASRGVVVLFGGSSVASGLSGLLGDTWEYDGVSWRERTSQPGPSPRSGAAMVYDPIHEKIVLVGGYDAVDGGELGLTSDTWEYSDGAWSQITTIASPGPRKHHALAWDVAGDRIVLFGGIRATAAKDTETSSAETWELTLDGSGGGTWTCTSGFLVGDPATSTCPDVTAPSPRSAVGMSYSTAQDALVLFGGRTSSGTLVFKASDTWVYSRPVPENPDVVAWSNLSLSAAPSGRSHATLVEVSRTVATISPTRHLVLIGGATSSGSSDELWELLEDTAWVPMLTPGTAPPRAEAAVVYDPVCAQTFMIGGYLSPSPRAEVYSFDGELWRFEKGLPSEPDARRFAASVTYDSTLARIVVFGGTGFAGEHLGDTYARSSGASCQGPHSWVDTIASGPSPRSGGAFAHDPTSGISVLFGGGTGSTPEDVVADTWELDGDVWTENPSAGGPEAQYGAAMAYDPSRQRLVLHDVAGVTWVYEKRAWTQLPTTQAPPARFRARLVYSTLRDRLVLYAGLSREGESIEILSDMWELVERDGQLGWEPVVYANPPPPRYDPGFVAVPSLEGLLVHGGGLPGNDPGNDTWIFQYRSEE